MNTKALLDTGADACFVSQTFIDRLPNRQHQQIKTTRMTCTLADQGKITVVGVIKLPVYIARTKYNIEFRQTN